jgi:hypothetical protein
MFSTICFRFDTTVKATATTPEVVISTMFDDATYWVYYHTLSTPGVWLFTLLLLIVALIPDVVLRTFKKHYLALRMGLRVSRNRTCSQCCGSGSVRIRNSRNESY